MSPERVLVSLRGNDEPSGLSMIMLQYFEQNIRDFQYKSEQARAITGKLAIEAVEGDVGVTLDFKGNEIEISEGCASDAKLFIRGGIFDLTELAAGGSGGIGKLLGRKLKTQSAWKHPMFAFRVARFMSLPAEMRTEPASRTTAWKLAAAAGGAAAVGLAAYFLLR